ncbi:sensor histidine kinase [Nitratifractor sp.]
MAALILLFSTLLYFYIRHNVEKELQHSLVEQASYLFGHYDRLEETLAQQKGLLRQTLGIEAEIVTRPDAGWKPHHFESFKRDHRFYLRGLFPYDFDRHSYLLLTRDITQPMRMVEQVFRAIVFLNLVAMLLIILYAYILSKMLIAPISFFSKKLARMDGNVLETINTREIPEEFRPLAHSVNQLVSRIKNYILYNKELFVGAAHELKTPLAVLKTRSQVALIKRDKNSESLQKVIEENITTVDDMSEMVRTILEFGRAEGAQLDQAKRLDIKAFLQQKIEEFRLLAHTEGKEIHSRLKLGRLEILLQPTLLTQILQNLLQNALRYTPEGGIVHLYAYRKGDRLIVKIRDEGPGLDDSFDPFAPFKRGKDSPGAGLGLFLVRNAVDSLGGEITLQNREDRRGAIATLLLPIEGND